MTPVLAAQKVPAGLGTGLIFLNAAAVSRHTKNTLSQRCLPGVFWPASKEEPFAGVVAAPSRWRCGTWAGHAWGWFSAHKEGRYRATAGKGLPKSCFPQEAGIHRGKPGCRKGRVV